METEGPDWEKIPWTNTPSPYHWIDPTFGQSWLVAERLPRHTYLTPY